MVEEIEVTDKTLTVAIIRCPHNIVECGEIAAKFNVERADTIGAYVNAS